jgi:hypothetical protein
LGRVRPARPCKWSLARPVEMICGYRCKPSSCLDRLRSTGARRLGLHGFPRAHDRNTHRLDADSQTRRNRAFDRELRSSFGSFGKDLELDAHFQCIVACVHARTGISSKNQPGLMHKTFASAISRVAPTRLFPASHSRTCRTDIPRATASVFRLIPSARRRARNRLPICLSTGLGMTI